MRHLHRHDYVIDRTHRIADERRKLCWGLALTLAAALGLIALVLLS